MKKFFIKSFILFCIVFVPILIPNIMYTSTNHWKQKDYVYQFYSVPKNIQVANVGTSHGFAGFKYDNMGYNGFNFGLPYQNYYYDLAQLKQFINHFQKDAVLIIPISYLQITATLDHELENFRPRYYRYMNPKYMDFWSVGEFLRYGVFPIFSSGGIENIVDRIKNDIPEESISHFNIAVTTMANDLEKLTAYCKNKLYQWTREDVDKGIEGYNSNMNKVCEIIELCLANDIKPVLVSTPMPDLLNEMFAQKEGFFDRFYSFTKDIQEKYPFIPYFDYSHDEYFSSHYELFSDGEHLNVYGAEQFTKCIIQDLQNASLL